ncbi:MAG: AI-2E family transporter [Verrucomicrobiales bacterium]
MDEVSTKGNGDPALSGEKSRKRAIIFFIVLAAAVLVFIKTFSLLSPILLAFFLIFFFTLAVNPLISRLRIWKGGRGGATLLVVVALLGLLSLAGWAAVGPLKSSVATLSERLPEYWERLQRPLIKMEQKAANFEEEMQVEVSAEIARNAAEAGESTAPPDEEEKEEKEKEGASLRDGLIGMLQGVFQQIKGVVFDTTQMLIVVVTVFFGVTFTLMNPRPVVGALFSVVPESQHDRTMTIMKRIAEFVPRWAGAMLVGMLTVGVLFFLLMWPIFGFTDAIILGLIACVLSSIPFFGPLLSVLPALLLAIDEGGMTPLWVILAYIAVQALEGNVVLPLVMSRAMNLHPMAVIFSILLSVAAFGVLGALIAAPLVAVARIVHDEIYRKRFLPSVTDEDLDRLAGNALNEKSPPP